MPMLWITIKQLRAFYRWWKIKYKYKYHYLFLFLLVIRLQKTFFMNMNLYIVSVDLINGLYPIVLDVLSLIAIFVGILVITTKNPVYTPL